jgi:hypothetical protein
MRLMDWKRFEVLQERLKTDRKIVRNLVSAAQSWEEFRRVLQSQLTSLEPLENIHLDPRWTEGREDYWQIHAVCTGYQQQFKNIDFRICTELVKETDVLIQRVTNLISIDEGYRSREQNDSIRRLSWITVRTFDVKPLRPANRCFSSYSCLSSLLPASSA